VTDSAIKTIPAERNGPLSFEQDPRWLLAQRVAGSRHFARSRLLSHFLLYIVAETLENRRENITEHQIGVRVFDRPSSYRSVEDNIVRNYARQLRRRLSDYFSAEGRNESLRIEIPLGGYIPQFVESAEGSTDADDRLALSSDEPTSLKSGLFNGPSRARALRHSLSSAFGSNPWLRRALFCLYSAAIVAATWLVAWIVLQSHPVSDPTRQLWNALFVPTANTYIVPPDSGFNILEDMSHRSLSLADYMKGVSLDLPNAEIQQHADQDLRTQQYTDFVSMQIVATLARQPQYNPQRVLLRFPRDLRLNDLKTANAILIGSPTSNPWASLLDATTNFRIEPGAGMESATIVNAKPEKGEASAYASHWNEPAHETYALILFMPNLSGTGHVLVIEGLDVAGTEAAAELLFNPESIAPFIHSIEGPGGTPRPFEILLRATSIQSNAEGTQIIATRVH
jgi:hypothetical protein